MTRRRALPDHLNLVRSTSWREFVRPKDGRLVDECMIVADFGFTVASRPYGAAVPSSHGLPTSHFALVARFPGTNYTRDWIATYPPR